MGEFRLIAELGGGGMGVVYEAEQESLGRRVALKLIRPEQLWFGGSRARFRREIEAVARLSHPGIVPIYTVGEEAGVPFFAMELIEGCTLAQAMTQLSGRPVAKLTGADLLLAIDQCAGSKSAEQSISRSMELAPAANWTEVSIHIVREVAEALEHAHSRGVVHRDIKPSNIVLTRTGRALLIDFGLASKAGSERITRSGSAGGSAAYMSPEQTRGEAVDARTDVYSLGVTFAELLTLRPLFRATPLDELWRSILAGEYERPRQRVPSIPWDVDTVCATAMETSRERRYATAGDFARDLSNLLAHRPIDARRAGVMLRVLRWAQRHPRVSAAVLAGSALGLIGALVYARQQVLLGGQIRAQRDVARERATELRELATSFVFDVHERIKRLPGSTEARERIVTQMQRLFDTLSKVDAQDPTLAHDLAFANLALGTMLEKTAGGTLGQATSSGEHLERAWQYFDTVARSPGASISDRRLLVQAEKVFGNFQTSNKQPERGRELLLRGAADARAVAQDAAASVEDRVAVVALDLQLGETMARLGRTQDAHELYSAATTRLEAMEQEFPKAVLVLRSMPHAYLLLADNLEQTGDVPRAVLMFEAGIQAGDRLLAIEPVPPLNRRGRADCVTGLALAKLRLSDPVGAAVLLERALSEYEELRKGDPSELQCTLDIARAHSSRSEALSACGDEQGALAAARNAVRELESVAPSAHSRELTHRKLDALSQLAEVELQLGALADAREHFRSADEVARAMLAEDSNDFFAVSRAAQLLRDWAELEAGDGSLARALELHRLCIAAYGRWLTLAPQHPIASTEESYERTLLAKSLAAVGLLEGSLQEHRTACEHSRASMGREFHDAVMLERGVFTQLSAAEVLGSHGASLEADAALAQGMEWAERVLASEPRRELTRTYLLAALDLSAQRARQRAEEPAALDFERRALERRAIWVREEGANPIEAIALAKELIEGATAELRNPALALELCRLSVLRAPTQPVAHYWLAKALEVNGDAHSALESARAAQALMPLPVAVADEKLAKRVAELIDRLAPRR